MNYEGRSGVDTSRRDSQYRSNPVKPPRREGDCNLPMNMNRKGNLLTPALCSTSVWRRGRWNGVRGFWGSMREIVRGILSRRRGDGSTMCGENPTKLNQIKPAGWQGQEWGWPVVSGQWLEVNGGKTGRSNPVKASQTESNRPGAGGLATFPCT
jgi:hypothetical protein